VATFAENALAADRAKALALTPVSRETLARLDRFVALLLKWQQTTHLIAPSTVQTLWTRHIADSLQLIELAGEARVWADMGSGAGFPGLVLACAFCGQAGKRVHLIESNTKKAAFLRAGAAATGSPALVHAVRMEKFVESVDDKIDVVTARAVSPLGLLLRECEPLLRAGALGLFPKGQDVGVELTEASRSWKIAVELVPSRTDSRGRIVVVRGLERAGQVP
jgi:16S rRNA (guanine527-N7)-methyltransferase